MASKDSKKTERWKTATRMYRQNSKQALWDRKVQEAAKDIKNFIKGQDGKAALELLKARNEARGGNSGFVDSGLIIFEKNGVEYFLTVEGGFVRYDRGGEEDHSGSIENIDSLRLVKLLTFPHGRMEPEQILPLIIFKIDEIAAAAPRP